MLFGKLKKKDKPIWPILRKDIRDLENVVTALMLRGLISSNIVFYNYKDAFSKVRSFKFNSKYNFPKETKFVMLINNYLINYNITIHGKETYTRFLCKCYDKDIDDFIIEAVTRSKESDFIIHDKFIPFSKMIEIINKIINS